MIEHTEEVKETLDSHDDFATWLDTFIANQVHEHHGLTHEQLFSIYTSEVLTDD